MAFTNNLKTVVDQPVWEWGRFSPVASVALSAWATAEDGLDEYIYYLPNTTLFRYSVKSDTWMQLATNLFTPVTTYTLRYSKYSGNRGRILGLNPLNPILIKIPFLKGGSALTNKEFRITSGPNMGYEGTIVYAEEENIEDFGVVTSGSTAVLTDNTKKWKINQWVGYSVRITFGTGTTQQRTVIYNNDTSLYFIDNNYQMHETWDNIGFINTPTTAGSTSSTHYVISSQSIALMPPPPAPFTDKDRFLVMTGGLWAFTGQSGAPFAALSYYDVLTDVWYNKTIPNGLFTGAVGTDFSIERTGEIGGSFLSGNATSGGSRTLTDSSLSLEVDEYRNYQIRITSGMGKGQRRRIVGNKSNYFEVNRKWDIVPDATSSYKIYGDTDNLWFMGNGQSAMFKYHIEYDLWTSGSAFDHGIMTSISATVQGSYPVTVSSGIRNTNGILTVNTTPIAGGSNYRIGDVLTLSTGGSNGKVTVETVSSTGAVLSVSLRRCGSGYGTVTSATTGGTGTGCTVAITSVGVVGYITTGISHFFKIGDSVTIGGCSEAAWNNTYTIIGNDQSTNTTFDIAITATANMANANTLSTSLIVDPTANWDVNEHTGRLVATFSAGPAGAVSWMRIASNTATTLTLIAATGNVAAGNRYVIQDCAALGRDVQFKQLDKFVEGYATSGSTTTLVDTSKNWIPSSWAGYRVRIVAGTGLGNEITITSNTETTLTYPVQTFTPDATTRYQIMDTFGLATGGSTSTLIDTTKNWITNQWSGKRFRYLSSTGTMVEQTVTSNTNNTLTFSASTAPATTTNYVIYSTPVRGVGFELNWLFGAGMHRYLLAPRGSGWNAIDYYDITKEIFELTPFISPQFETFSTGSMYAYDGGKYVYINKESTNRIYRLDVTTRTMENAGTIPYGHSTALVGNRMEVISTPEGLKFLYIMRHNAQELFRALVFW